MYQDVHHQMKLLHPIWFPSYGHSMNTNHLFCIAIALQEEYHEAVVQDKPLQIHRPVYDYRYYEKQIQDLVR